MRRVLVVVAVLVLGAWGPCAPPSGGGDDVAGMTPAGLAALQAGEPWHYVGDTGEPAFGTGWGNAGGGTSATAFRSRQPDLVDLYLGATVGSSPETFTLPEGYRPPADTLAVGSGYTFGGSSDSIAVAILTDGTVQPIMPGGSTVAVFAGYFWFTPPDVVL